jgi:hypothetical protein
VFLVCSVHCTFLTSFFLIVCFSNHKLSVIDMKRSTALAGVVFLLAGALVLLASQRAADSHAVASADDEFVERSHGIGRSLSQTEHAQSVHSPSLASLPVFGRPGAKPVLCTAPPTAIVSKGVGKNQPTAATLAEMAAFLEPQLVGCARITAAAARATLVGATVAFVGESCPQQCTRAGHGLSLVAADGRCYCASNYAALPAEWTPTCPKGEQLAQVFARPDWLLPPGALRLAAKPLRVLSCSENPSSDPFRLCWMAAYATRPYVYHGLDCTKQPAAELHAAAGRLAFDGEGPVLVGLHVFQQKEVNELFATQPLPNVALLLQQDEHGHVGFDPERFGALEPRPQTACPVWKNYFHANQTARWPFLRFFPLGPRVGPVSPVRSLLQRSLVFSFLGSPTSDARVALAARGPEFIARWGADRIVFHVSQRWERNPGKTADSKSPAEYARLLQDSMFALVVAGHNIEQFRFYEAMSVGTIPVLARSETHVALAPALRHSPAIFVESWDTLSDELEALLAFVRGCGGIVLGVGLFVFLFVGSKRCRDPRALLARQRDMVLWYHAYMHANFAALDALCFTD